MNSSDGKNIIIDQTSYDSWIKKLRDELAKYLSIDTAIFSILDCKKIEPSAILSGMSVDDIQQTIKKSPPSCISYCEVVNYTNDFANTKIFNIVSITKNLDETYNDFLNIKSDEFEFLKNKIIGFKIYLHYPSVTYKIKTGYVDFFEEITYSEIDESEDDIDTDYNDEEDEETEEERHEREEYEKNAKDLQYKMDALSKELSTDKRLALTRNKDQRYSLAKMYFGERLSGWSEWDIESIVVHAVNIFQIEVLPNLVLDLIKQGKTPKQISDALGISLAKARHLIAIVE